MLIDSHATTKDLIAQLHRLDAQLSDEERAALAKAEKELAARGRMHVPTLTRLRRIARHCVNRGRKRVQSSERPSSNTDEAGARAYDEMVLSARAALDNRQRGA
jgi:hypothetical protein